MEKWYLIVIAAMGIILIAGFFYTLNLQEKNDALRIQAETNQRLTKAARETADHTHNVLMKKLHKLDQYKNLCKDFRHNWHIDDITRLFHQDLPDGYNGVYAVTRRDMPMEYEECAYIIANIFPFNDSTKEYAYMCAEELVEKLNEQI